MSYHEHYKICLPAGSRRCSAGEIFLYRGGFDRTALFLIEKSRQRSDSAFWPGLVPVLEFSSAYTFYGNLSFQTFRKISVVSGDSWSLF